MREDEYFVNIPTAKVLAKRAPDLYLEQYYPEFRVSRVVKALLCIQKILAFGGSPQEAFKSIRNERYWFEDFYPSFEWITWLS